MTSTQQWHRDQLTARLAAVEAREKRERDELERWATQLRAKRARRARWGLPLVAPTRPHAELEKLSKDVWARGFTGPWPSGWTVQWARLPRQAPDNVTAAARCFHRERQILVDENLVRPRELEEVLTHELSHVVVPGAGHGDQFTRALSGALARLRTTTTTTPQETTMATLMPASRRELLSPGQLHPSVTAMRLRAIINGLEARSPGSTAGLSFKPYTDARGRWHPGPILRPRREPLSVAAAMRRTARHKV